MRRALLGIAAGAATALPMPANATLPAAELPEPFVPENDYPYFGCEPGGGCDPHASTIRP
jgi:hypothetical protein